jgi:hypothetical protein
LNKILFSPEHTKVLADTPLAGHSFAILKTAKIMDTKKDVGVLSLSAPIPIVRP